MMNLADLLPWPAKDAHKYSRGRCTIVAGSAAYPGAACLATYAAERMGAGYVELFCAPEVKPLVQIARPSVVVRSWDELAVSELPLRDPARPRAYVVGPGFDTGDEDARAVLMRVLAHASDPVLVDGGALGMIASEEGLAACRARADVGRVTVLTPHGGEAAALARGAGADASAVGEQIAQAYRCLCVAKGPDTDVRDARDQSKRYLMQEGTPALAKAGSGDVLAGMIGALLAQRLDPFDASVLGAVLHARAGRAAAERLTEICVTALDVIEAIPDAVRTVAADSRSGAILGFS